MATAIIAAYIAKAFVTLWKQRIALVRSFQESLSEAGMGRFITHYGRTEAVKADQEELMANVVNAYIIVITPCALLSAYGDEIMNTPFLDEFFSRYEAYKKWKEIKRAIGEKTIPVINWEAFLGEIINLFELPELFGKLQEIIDTLWNLSLYLYELIMALVTAQRLGPVKMVMWVNQRFRTHEFPPWLGLIPAWIWRLIHPTLDFDWTVIKSYIVLYYTYRAIRLDEELRQFVPPYIKQQAVKITVDGEQYPYQFLKTDGFLKIKIPRGKWRDKASVDTFGLTYDVSRLVFGPEILDLRAHSIYDVAYMYYDFGTTDDRIANLYFHDMGKGVLYCYATFPAWALNGNKFKIKWKTYTEKPLKARFRIYSMDGEYDRKSEEDFPIGAWPPEKGNGLLQLLWEDYYTTDPQTKTFTININPALEKVTLFFELWHTYYGMFSNFLIWFIELLTPDEKEILWKASPPAEKIVKELITYERGYGYIELKPPKEFFEGE